MKAIIACIIISSFLISFSSCQREVDVSFTTTAEDSTYLVKQVSLDTTKPVGQDTGMIANFFYDANKRLTKYDFTEIGLGGTRYTTYYTFYYGSASDTAPYKRSAVYNSAIAYPDSTVSYFSYSSGFIIKDSAVSYLNGIADEIIKKEFSSLGNNMYLLKQYDFYAMVGSWSFADSVIYKRTFNNGNVASAIDSFWNGGVTFYGVDIEECTYDAKNGAYNKFKTWYLGYHTNLVNEPGVPGPHNLASYTWKDDSPGNPIISSYVFSYEYNEAGYPVVVRLAGNDDVNKSIYTYTKL